MKHITERSEFELEREHKLKLSKIDFDALTDKYENNFFLYKSEWRKEQFNIVLVKRIAPHDSIYPLDHLYNPYGDSFTVFKNDKIKDSAGWARSETEEGFNNIHFMSATEFYAEHTELCEKLFFKIINELKSNWSDWYLKTLKWYKEVLETIPELQYIKDSEKYNI